MVLRADEIQSIEKNRQEREFEGRVKKGAKTALGIGALIAAPHLTGLASRISPFLNELVPAELALKGINKISPKLGSFLKTGVSKGLDLREGFNFIKENLSSSNQPAQKNTNIIQQYSPELHEFIITELKKGRNPLQAGALAQFENKYKNVIKKLEKDHKSPFSAILESVYGSAEQPQQFNQSQQPQQQSGLSPAMQKLGQFVEQGYQILGGK